MTLTEQWKKGELEAGWYYVLLFSNEEYITFIDGNWVVDDRLIGADIKEVLAPVPSYEEWKSAYECQIMESEEVTTLKKLLKECKEYIDGIDWNVNNSEFFAKIDNAIGEK